MLQVFNSTHPGQGERQRVGVCIGRVEVVAVGRALDEDGMLGALRQQRGGGVRDAIPYRWVHQITMLTERELHSNAVTPRRATGR